MPGGGVASQVTVGGWPRSSSEVIWASWLLVLRTWAPQTGGSALRGSGSALWAIHETHTQTYMYV